MTIPAPNDPLLDSSVGSFASGAPIEGDASSGYERFDLAEAVTVLSNYDLGIVSAVQEYRRGSRRSPKLLVKCDHGLLILKRLAPGRDDPARIAFAHEVQRVLIGAGFPLPRLASTRGGSTLLSLGGRSYELFECVVGQPYDLSPEATLDAGAALARFHSILAARPPAGQPPTGSYHRLPAVVANLAFIPHRLGDESLASVVQVLGEAYNRAADRADALGLSTWPMQIIHGDWHPGNLLFRGQRVASVIDYDTARLQPRVVDIANGALQFSLTRTSDDPSLWPEGADEARLKRFVQGYDSASASMVSRGELEALPWLMIEAMIAESATPIAVTGRFGRMAPGPFLRMVERKVRWIQSGSERITRLLS
ncbi:MAG: phosphotransferase [Phycisphaerae bacterium]|nr:phosphotransferase [Phycisphaerae bacterium]